MENADEVRKIEIDEKTLKYLNTSRKWAMFLAIIGFIILGLFLIIGLIAGTFLTVFNLGSKDLGVPESFMFVPVLILAIGYAVQTLDKEQLHKALRSLKSYFVYVGILIIVVILCYVTMLILAGPSLTFLKGLA
jgi:ABC-type multidrug transport system fused ATPase/permease subunit